MNTMGKTLVAAVAMMFVTPTKAQTIGPTGQATSSYSVITQGQNAAGQSLTSPGGSLTSFSFHVNFATSGNVRFVFAPINGRTVGAPLYSSAPFQIASQSVNTVSGFSVPTVANQTYAGYFTTFEVANAATTVEFFEYSGNPYMGGTEILKSGTGNPSNADFAPDADFDFAFSATFSPTGAAPEPGSWALMILGFGIVGGALRTRRRRASQGSNTGSTRSAMAA